jgi:hypothetical protein
MNNYYIQGLGYTCGAMIGAKIIDSEFPISWETIVMVAAFCPMWIAVDHFINHRKK